MASSVGRMIGFSDMYCEECLDVLEWLWKLFLIVVCIELKGEKSFREGGEAIILLEPLVLFVVLWAHMTQWEQGVSGNLVLFK